MANELALFAGGGGGILGSFMLGWRTRCAVEIDPYARNVLLARQRDGQLEPFPIWDDIRTFDGRPWRGLIDVVTGGFPCQDISLWFEMLRVIGEVRPRAVLAENSPMLRTRGLDRVVSGLTGLGYRVRWGVLGAGHIGAPHRRNRMWIVADTDDAGQRVFPKHAKVARPPTVGGRALGIADADSEVVRVQQGRRCGAPGEGAPEPRDDAWWREHRFAGVDDGLAHRVDRVRVTGNGQIPHVAYIAATVLGGL